MEFGLSVVLDHHIDMSVCSATDTITDVFVRPRTENLWLELIFAPALNRPVFANSLCVCPSLCLIICSLVATRGQQGLRCEQAPRATAVHSARLSVQPRPDSARRTLNRISGTWNEKQGRAHVEKVVADV